VAASLTFPPRRFDAPAPVLTPSPAVKLLVQVVPLSTEYDTVAPVSVPVTFNKPSDVMRSVLETPVSLAKATLGTAGEVVSNVKVNVAASLTCQPCRLSNHYRVDAFSGREAAVQWFRRSRSTLLCAVSTPVSVTITRCNFVGGGTPVSLAKATLGGPLAEVYPT